MILQLKHCTPQTKLQKQELMKKSKIDKEIVYKNFGWKPDDGDYSVTKENEVKKSKDKTLNSFAKKFKSLIDIAKK